MKTLLLKIFQNDSKRLFPPNVGPAPMARGLSHCDLLLVVSHHSPGSNHGRGKWKSCQWLRVRRRFFAWYIDFLHHLQLAYHELVAICHKKWRKKKRIHSGCRRVKLSRYLWLEWRGLARSRWGGTVEIKMEALTFGGGRGGDTRHTCFKQ